MNYGNQLSDSIKLYKGAFPKKWVNTLSNDYHENITFQEKINKSCLNKRWFVKKDTRLGNYEGRNDDYIDPAVSDYFDRLLYGSNIFAIDYILKNREVFKGFKFCDIGCGYGLLSVFLQKLNIGLDCYNHENFSQLGDIEDILNENKFFDLYNIMAPSSKAPQLNFDVLYTADITGCDKLKSKRFHKNKAINILNDNTPRFLMIEHWYSEISDFSPCPEFEVLKNYSMVADYGPLLRVYERK